ncbi:hypothetical protein ACEWPM_003885 [Roseovarius sp. S4756]|uniref:hypothetical protein n=1 Tax=Roseovarius maritimus TaxID=3342637 RepID=UPI003726D85D
MIMICAATSASAQAFAADDVRRYNLGQVNAPAYLAGFDSATLRTRPRCARARNDFVDSPSNPANSEFRYISSVDEIFSQQKLAVGARVAVKYMGVGASVDTRYSQIETSSRRFENGAIYGYFERVEPIRFLSAPRIRLTERGRRLHDEAVLARNMAAFFSECGDELIVGRQKASYAQVIGTYTFQEGMSEMEKSLAVEASVKVATGVLNVSASAGVEEDQHLREAFARTEVLTDTIFTGNPIGCGAPSQTLESAGEFFSCFTAQDDRLTSDLHAVYTVRYQDVIDGFGTLPDLDIAEDRENDVRRILNGLSLHELALLEIVGRNDGQEALLHKDHARMVTRFVREGGCLTRFGPYCENLLVRLRTHPPATRANARALVEKMLQLNRRCTETGAADVTAWPLVSGRGFLGCRRCGIGLSPIFIDGRNAQCGLPIAPPEDNVVRYFAKDLTREAMVPGGSDSGGASLRDVYLSTCASAGEDCGTPRANAICAEKGFERMRRYQAARYPLTLYGDGRLCSQTAQDTQLTPQVCRTFAMLDCACPPGHQAVGRSCVFVPEAAEGVAIEFHNDPDPDEQDSDLGLTAVPGAAEVQPLMIFEGIRLPAQPED